ncbi:MAG: SPASM domain-containing protein, partial [Planctomycetota bacterium]
IRRLQRHGVEFNILTLVSAANVERGGEVYRYLRESGFAFHQYIPCVEFDEGGDLRPFAITGEGWGEFLCEVFDEWAARDVGLVSVRLFDSLLEYLLDGARNVCTMRDNCRNYFLVEHNGDVYPCDFFVEDDLRLGNVMTHSWGEMLESPLYAAFGARKRETDPLCGECEFFEFCAGDCVKNRLRAGDDPRQLSWLCAGWRRFHSHALGRLREIAQDIRLRRALSGGTIQT